MTRAEQLRRAALLTVEDLAAITGVSKRTIYRIEDPSRDTEPRLTSLRPIAQHFGVSPDELMRPAIPEMA